jgi:hypothetical protein
MIHLAFIGAQYALCGADVQHDKKSTQRISDATCPDCKTEYRNDQFVNRTLHEDGLIPDYE